MTKSLSRRAIIASAGSLALAGCARRQPAYRVRYELSVVMEIDGQRRKAAKVMETRYYKNPSFLVGFDGIYPTSSTTTANAVEFPLDKNASVFAMFGNLGLGARREGFIVQMPTRPIYISMPEDMKNSDPDVLSRGDQALVSCENFSGVAIAAPFLPSALYLPDRNTPAKAVFYETTDGPGLARVISATARSTDAPLSRGLEKTFPWWNDVDEPRSSDPVLRGFPFSLRRQNLVVEDEPDIS